MNFYNEIDPFAAAWLRELIKAGHIAPGVVDERSIEDITPDELRGFTQCHFFAGIGVWSYALRRAGWPDDRPVWTGSCPCQPFSVAGKGRGVADERHLWPAWFHLIAECKPRTLFGEQVDAAIRQGWLDLVQTDLEGIGYAFGAIGLPACGFGAPHIRQRLYFVGNAPSGGRQPITAKSGEQLAGMEPSGFEPFELSSTSGGSLALVYADGLERQRRPDAERPDAQDSPERGESLPDVERDGFLSGEQKPGATNGAWGVADWLRCRDEKWRPVEPGSFPLAYGSPARVGRLRGYGNAIVAPVAEAFITAAMEAI